MFGIDEGEGALDLVKKHKEAINMILVSTALEDFRHETSLESFINSAKKVVDIPVIGKC